MAVDITKTVSLVFEAYDKTGDVFQRISRSLGEFSGIADSIAQPLASITDGILAADAALAAFVATTMALAIREAGKFGDAFAEITTLIDMPAESLGDFRQEILDYSKDSTSSIEDINRAIYTAISAGVDYSKSLDVLAASEKLAIAGKGDLEATTRLLASSLNAYGESADQAGRYSDVFFKTVKLGQTTLPELAASLSQVSGIASAAGVPIETLSASIAAVTATGAPTSQAITGIRAAIQAIIKPTGEAAQIADSLGLQFSATALKTKGFEGVLQEAYRATGGNVEKMGQLFTSVEGLSVALTLGADKSGKYADALTQMQAAAGATDEAYSKMAKNFALTNQNLWNNAQALLIEIGTKLLDPYYQAAAGIKAVVQAISQGVTSGAFDPLFEAFDDFAGRLKAFLDAVAKALPEALTLINFDGLLSALGELGGAVGSFFDDLDLTRPEDLAKAMQKAIDLVESLVRITSGMATAMKPFVEAISAGIDQVNNLDAEAREGFGNVLLMAKLVAEAGLAVAAAFATMGATGADVRGVMDVIAGSVRFVWNTLQALFDSLAGEIVAMVKTAVDALEYLTRLPGLSDFNAKLKGIQQDLAYTLKGIQADQFIQFEDAAAGAAQAMRGLTGETAKAKDGADALAASAAKIPGELTASAEKTAEWMADPILSKVLVVAPEANAQANIQRRVDETLKGVKAEAVATLVPEIGKEAKAKFEEQLEIMKLRSAEMQHAVEWKAKLDIAQVESNARIVEAAFSSIGQTITSTGNVLSDLWATAAQGDLGIRQQQDIMNSIEAEEKNRKKAIDSQIEYMNAVKSNSDALRKTLERGDAIFKVSLDGAVPELEMLLWAILERLRIAMNASGAQFLMGLNPTG